MTARETDPAVVAAPAARNSLFILAARLLEMAASVGVAAIIARHLGVEAYGRYALIVAFVMLFGQFISFGLEHIIIREVSRAPGRLREFLGAGMTLEAMLGAAVVPLAVAASMLLRLEPGDGRGVLIFGVAFFFRAFYEVVFRSTFIAFGAAKFETLLTFVFQGLRLALVAGGALAGGGVVTILAAVLAAEAVNAVLAYGILRRKFAPARPRLAWPRMWYLLAQAWPIATMGILNNVFFQQDTLIIKWLVGDYGQVGLFAAAYRLVTFFIFLTVPMLWPLLPEFSRAAQAGDGELAAAARRAARAVMFVVLPPAVLAAFFARQIVALVFGAGYGPAAGALAVLAVSMAARPLGYMADSTLIAARRQWFLALTAGVAVSVNFLLDVWLIPRVGFIGAAWGTAAADIVGLAASVAIASLALRRPVVGAGALPPAALAAAVGGGLLLASGAPWWILLPAAALAFGAGSFILSRPEERRALKRALGIGG